MACVAHWAETAVFWHLYPLGFVGAPASAAGPDAAAPRLRRLNNWLDYLIELGANGLLLGPVFASETHGYDTVDHYRIDPRLGTEADLVDLFEQASSRGIMVVLDGVFNHVGRGFPQLTDVVEHGSRLGFDASGHRSVGAGCVPDLTGQVDEPIRLDELHSFFRIGLAERREHVRHDFANMLLLVARKFRHRDAG